MCFRLLKPKQNKINPVTMVLSAPNWYGVKPIRLFLIKIKDVPQIRESITRNNHFFVSLVIAFKNLWLNSI